jgi:hypothetical protein
MGQMIVEATAGERGVEVEADQHSTTIGLRTARGRRYVVRLERDEARTVRHAITRALAEVDR